MDFELCTYRATVGILGLCCLPIVGIPLFLPWLNDDDELRGIDVCPFAVVVVISANDDDGICSTDDCVGIRRGGATCERGLLLTSLSKLFSVDVNCLAVNVEPKSFVDFLPFLWTVDGGGGGGNWTFGLLLL